MKSSSQHGEGPAFGEPLSPAHPSEETLALLDRRRSTAADLLGAPGPSADQLAQILRIAARVPDHRRVVPFRFIIIEGEARLRAGDVLAKAFQANEAEAAAERVEKERNRFLRAPVVVAVISCVDKDHRTPEWEQVLTVGAVCQNMLIAASASGFAAQWLTEWYAFDKTVETAFSLGVDERFAGFIYIGTAREDPKERMRPVVSDIISQFVGG